MTRALCSASNKLMHFIRSFPCKSSSSSFFFNDPAPTEIYTLSLHDALPICAQSIRWRYGRIRPSSRDASRRRFKDGLDRKSTRLNSSHVEISYAVFCLKKKKKRYSA